MPEVLLAICVVAALLDGAVRGMTPTTGKCIDNPCNMTRIPLNGALFEDYKPWKVIYTSGSVNSEVRDGFRVVNNLFWGTDVIKTSDSGTKEYDFAISVVDNLVVEDSLDEKGNAQRVYNYPLAVTLDYGFLFYRCSKDGQAEVDARYIWIPANVTVSDTSIQYLLDVDSKCNFRGKLHKLPEKP